MKSRTVCSIVHAPSFAVRGPGGRPLDQVEVVLRLLDGEEVAHTICHLAHGIGIDKRLPDFSASRHEGGGLHSWRTGGSQPVEVRLERRAV